MNEIYPIYMLCWGTACIVALALFIGDRTSYAISRPAYWQFLFTRWKLATFALASTGLTVIAPYTDDPTWDYLDSIGMSLLTFAAAPWAVGVIYKSIRGLLPLRQLYVAVCTWMFTVSWSFDTYILIRDGEYTPLWLPNIFASSALYLFAGMMWNLDWKSERGTFFAFMEDDWPRQSQERKVFGRIIWWVLFFALTVSGMIVPFLLWNLGL